VFGDRFKQPVLVPEEPINRRGLHARRLGDTSGGHGGRPVLAEQLGGGLDDPGAGVDPAALKLHHASNDSKKLLSM
jgi:hypothetical protein